MLDMERFFWSRGDTDNEIELLERSVQMRNVGEMSIEQLQESRKRRENLNVLQIGGTEIQERI